MMCVQRRERPIEEVQNAGIQVVMITGDRLETAVAIAKDAGLLKNPEDQAISSAQLNEMSDEEVKERIPHIPRHRPCAAYG